MSTFIKLLKSSSVGFDLDTRRPLFQSPAEAEAYIMTIPAPSEQAISFNSSNFNKIGDDMLIPGGFEEIAQFDIGVFQFTVGGTLFWFRIRDVFVNETNRTRVVYDVDFAMTYGGLFRRGHITRVPKGNAHARGMPVNPRHWEYKASTTFAPGIRVAFVLKQMKSSTSSSSYDVDGPVYCLIDCKWIIENPNGSKKGVNPLAELSATSKRFALSDVINAWIIPALGDGNDYNLRYWDNVDNPSTNVSWWRYTVSTSLANWDVRYTMKGVQPEILVDGLGGTILKGTDTSEGRMMGICDERGNVLYMFPDMIKPTTTFLVGFKMSMASCEMDVALFDGTSGFFDAHLADRMFTYSCRPLDVMADSWQDYLFRQRDADIENRRIQNNTALAGGVGNAASGALMGAAMGSVVPGLGTAAGAIAGGVTGIVGTAVTYGVQSYYGDKQQALIDKTFQLAQDQVAVSGMITSYAIRYDRALIVFMLEVDEVTKTEIEAQNSILGVPADGFTLNMSQDMADAMNADEFLPWAGTAEVDDSVDIPVGWKRIISEQLAAGARYKKFGTW